MNIEFSYPLSQEIIQQRYCERLDRYREILESAPKGCVDDISRRLRIRMSDLDMQGEFLKDDPLTRLSCIVDHHIDRETDMIVDECVRNPHDVLNQTEEEGSMRLSLLVWLFRIREALDSGLVSTAWAYFIARDEWSFAATTTLLDYNSFAWEDMNLVESC